MTKPNKARSIHPVSILLGILKVVAFLLLCLGEVEGGGLVIHIVHDLDAFVTQIFLGFVLRPSWFQRDDGHSSDTQSLLVTFVMVIIEVGGEWVWVWVVSPFLVQPSKLSKSRRLFIVGSERMVPPPRSAAEASKISKSVIFRARVRMVVPVSTSMVYLDHDWLGENGYRHDNH